MTDVRLHPSCEVPLARARLRSVSALSAAAAAALLATACSGTDGALTKAAATGQATRPAASTPAAQHPKTRAVYPLTGLPVTSKANAARPALSVKIDNVSDALPQAGINSADIVTEVLVEGGLTRLFATFQSHDAPLIGPIRSARPVDANLLRELGGGIFAYSGAAPGEIAPSKDHSTALLLSNDSDPRWFWRDANRAAPHNVFSSTSRLYLGGRTLRPHLRTAPQLFTYATKSPAGRAVHAAKVDFSGFSTATWTWTGHGYSRIQDNRPDTLVGGSQVTADNVVILSTTWHPTHIIDPAGNPDPFVVTVGHGRAWVLRNGKMIAGHWTRPGYTKPVQILDAHDRPIPLDPGRTWMELQPRPYSPVFS
jgi:hypothetical protein